MVRSPGKTILKLSDQHGLAASTGSSSMVWAMSCRPLPRMATIQSGGGKRWLVPVQPPGVESGGVGFLMMMGGISGWVVVGVGRSTTRGWVTGVLVAGGSTMGWVGASWVVGNTCGVGEGGTGVLITTGRLAQYNKPMPTPTASTAAAYRSIIWRRWR